MELHNITTIDGNVFYMNTPGARYILSATPPDWMMPPIDFARKRFYYQDGETEINQRLEPRSFSLELTIDDKCDRDALFTKRQELLNFLRFNRGGLLTYTFTTESGDTQYSIDGLSLARGGGVPDSTWDDNAYIETLEFDCSDPTWYIPTANTCNGTRTSSDQLVFPITFDDDNIFFGSAARWGQCTIDYSGATWYTYPVITATGPWTTLTINHTELAVSIFYSASAVAGDVITFDLRIRYNSDFEPIGPTVLDASGNSKFSVLDVATDLARFRFEPPSLKVPGGVNTITFDALGYTNETNFVITYNQRFIGI